MTETVDARITYIADISADAELDRAVLDELGEPVIVIDDDGTIVRANREAVNITAYSKLDLLGKSIEILVPESDREQHKKHRERYLTFPQPRQMGAHLNVDLMLLTRKNKIIPVIISLKPLVTSRGRFTSAVIRLKEEVRG